MAAILGTFRSLLPAVPALSAFTELLIELVGRLKVVGWDTPCAILESIHAQARASNKVLTK